MSTALYVVDTSYLVEFLDIPSFSHAPAVKEVRRKLGEAAAAGSRFCVPLACVYELANHVADEKHADRRRKLARFLADTVKTCVAAQHPWTITPASALDELPTLMELLATEFVRLQVGLTDIATIQEARMLREKYPARDYKVHIWTNDRALKGQEPDTEPSPFFW